MDRKLTDGNNNLWWIVGKEIFWMTQPLILKVLSKTVADNIVFFFSDKRRWHFMWLVCLALSFGFTFQNRLMFFLFLHKNYSYMPYRTLWYKISQNLAPLEGNAHKKIKSHRIFRPFYNKYKAHPVVVFTSFSHEKKGDLTILGELQSDTYLKKTLLNFVKSLNPCHAE